MRAECLPCPLADRAGASVEVEEVMRRARAHTGLPPPTVAIMWCGHLVGRRRARGICCNVRGRCDIGDDEMLQAFRCIAAWAQTRPPPQNTRTHTLL